MIIFFINAIKVIFLLGFLVFIHEGGHFLVAKICKVKVNEFAIGFGPILWKTKRKETKYALRLIPLGGFVSMEGEENHSEEEGSFSKASIPKRIAIIIAGGIVNIIFGLIVYFMLSACIGNFTTTIVQDTIKGYGAEKVGILQGDKIIKINDKAVRNQADLFSKVQKSNGEEVKLTFIRDGIEQEVYIKPKQEETNNAYSYYLGVNLKKAENNFANNTYYAFWHTVDFSLSIIDNLKMLFTGKVTVNQLMGPVGITSVVANTNGIIDYIYIFALISLSLGVTNLLPFPPLDGGKVVILLIEAIRKKPLKESVELVIQSAGFFILIFLSIYIAYNDILRIF